MSDIKDILKKNLNIPELIKEVVKEIAKPALDEAVAKSETKFDDMALAALYPILEETLFSKVDDLWSKL